MKQNMYITKQEQKKCRRVADFFAKLEMKDCDIIVADAGKYGFVRLLCYNECYGFEKVVCYTDSTALFNALWEDWLNAQLFQIALENPLLMNMTYEEIFQTLPEERQKELTHMRSDFAQKSGITDV